MHYLINDLIIYDAKNKTLTNRNFLDDSIELSPGSVAVLLDFLISYPHAVWTKAEIGEKAFSDSSYSGSESNVNKSLSLLRRSFKDVGEDSNIITTLSSRGVVFHANVTPYDDVSVASVPVVRTLSGKQRSVLMVGVLTTLTAISVFCYFTTVKSSECNLLSIGDPDAYLLAEQRIKELGDCKAPGIIINGANKYNEFKKNYSLVAMCEKSAHECLNFIEK